MSEKPIRAAILIIGDEILSGRTQDKNVSHIALWLAESGIDLMEVRVVPDDLEEVVEAVNALRGKYDYLFTTGGIGPTHDDITADCIAAAFDVPLDVNTEAYNRLEAHYGTADFSVARQRMARVPRGGVLIDNPVSIAPGFQMDNVFVMAGVPKIMQAMLEGVRGRLKTGAVVHSKSVTLYIAESLIAGDLADLDAAYPDVSMGSYPFFNFEEKRGGAQIVLRSRDEAKLETACNALLAWIEGEGYSHAL